MGNRKRWQLAAMASRLTSARRCGPYGRDRGIDRNGHMLMLANNRDEIAKLVVDRLEMRCKA